MKFIFLFFIFLTIIAWPLNVYRLIQCDFDSNKSWKGEIVHGIGIFAPTYVITAWSNWDE